MRRHSPAYYSPPRREYGGRGRSPPRRRYAGGPGGGNEGSRSLLVRNIPLNCRPDDLRIEFERFGRVRDVYLPKDYYSGEPRGFAFIEFMDPYDAMEAQYHMNGQRFGGREITVVVASENRKRPDDMRHRARVSEPSRHGGHRSSSGYGRPRSRSRSPHYRTSSRARHTSRSYSPVPRRQADYSPSPRRQADYSASPRKRTEHVKSPRRQADYSPSPRRQADHSASPRKRMEHVKSPRRQADYSPSPRRQADYSPSPRKRVEHVKSPRENSEGLDEKYNGRSRSPGYDEDNRNIVNGLARKEHYNDERRLSCSRSPRHVSQSPSGSRSRSADN